MYSSITKHSMNLNRNAKHEQGYRSRINRDKESNFLNLVSLNDNVSH